MTSNPTTIYATADLKIRPAMVQGGPNLESEQSVGPLSHETFTNPDDNSLVVVKTTVQASSTTESNQQVRARPSVAQPNKDKPSSIILRALDAVLTLPSKFVDYLEIREMRADKATLGGFFADFIRNRLFSSSTELPENVRNYTYEDPLSETICPDMQFYKDRAYWIKKFQGVSNIDAYHKEWKENLIPKIAASADCGYKSRRELVAEKLNIILDESCELAKRPYREPLYELVKSNPIFKSVSSIPTTGWLHIINCCVVRGHDSQLIRDQIISELQAEIIRPAFDNFIRVTERNVIQDKVAKAYDYLIDGSNEFEAFNSSELLNLSAPGTYLDQQVSSFLTGIPERITSQNLESISSAPDLSAFAQVLHLCKEESKYFPLLRQVSENIASLQNPFVDWFINAESSNGSPGEFLDSNTTKKVFESLVSRNDSEAATFSSDLCIDIFIEYIKPRAGKDHQILYAQAAAEEIRGTILIDRAIESKTRTLQSQRADKDHQILYAQASAEEISGMIFNRATASQNIRFRIEDILELCSTKELPLGSVKRWIKENNYFTEPQLKESALLTFNSKLQDMAREVRGCRLNRKFDNLDDFIKSFMDSHVLNLAPQQLAVVMNVAEISGCDAVKYVEEAMDVCMINSVLDIVENNSTEITFAGIEDWAMYGKILLNEASSCFSEDRSFKLNFEEVTGLFSESTDIAEEFLELVKGQKFLDNQNIDQIINEFLKTAKEDPDQKLLELIKSIDNNQNYLPIALAISERIGLYLNPICDMYQNGDRLKFDKVKTLTTDQFIENIEFGLVGERDSFSTEKCLIKFTQYLEFINKNEPELLKLTNEIVGVLQLRKWQPKESPLLPHMIAEFCKESGIPLESGARWHRENFGSKVTAQELKLTPEPKLQLVQVPATQEKAPLVAIRTLEVKEEELFTPNKSSGSVVVLDDLEATKKPSRKVATKEELGALQKLVIACVKEIDLKAKKSGYEFTIALAGFANEKITTAQCVDKLTETVSSALSKSLQESIEIIRSNLPDLTAIKDNADMELYCWIVAELDRELSKRTVI